MKRADSKEDKMKEKRIVALDSQVLNAIQSCETLADFSFIQNWRPNATPEPFEKGDLGHIALKNYYSIKHLSQETGVAFDSLQVIRDSLALSRAKSTDMDLPAQEVERILQITERYFHYYGDRDEFNIRAVERPFTRLLHEDDDTIIYYEGIIDLLYESKMTKLTVMDHKTKGKQYSHIERTNQFIGYSWAFDTNWVIVNGIGLQKDVSDEKRYKRQILSITDGVKEQWKKQAVKSVKRFISHLEVGEIEMNISHCPAWGGCQFKDACNAAGDKSVQLSTLMRMFYKGAPWSPYTRDDGKMPEGIKNPVPNHE